MDAIENLRWNERHFGMEINLCATCCTLCVTLANDQSSVNVINEVNEAERIFRQCNQIPIHLWVVHLVSINQFTMAIVNLSMWRQMWCLPFYGSINFITLKSGFMPMFVLVLPMPLLFCFLCVYVSHLVLKWLKCTIFEILLIYLSKSLRGK